MSSADATIHAEQYLICALQNPAPDSPLVTLVNEHNEALISLADIFGKSTSPEVLLRVLGRGGIPRKPNR